MYDHPCYLLFFFPPSPSQGKWGSHDFPPRHFLFAIINLVCIQFGSDAMRESAQIPPKHLPGDICARLSAPQMEMIKYSYLLDKRSCKYLVNMCASHSRRVWTVHSRIEKKRFWYYKLIPTDQFPRICWIYCKVSLAFTSCLSRPSVDYVHLPASLTKTVFFLVVRACVFYSFFHNSRT